MISIPIIDSHVHLWDPARLRYPWLEGLPALNRPFLPDHYRVACGPVNVEKMVFVECGCDASQNLAEVRWVTELARQEPRLAGLVAQVPLEQGIAARGQLAELAQNPRVKGVRRILQGEADPAFCLQPGFVAGVKLLPQFGFSFDLCVVAPQLPAVLQLAQQCPEVGFILDHAAKPAIRDQVFEPWRQHLRALSALPNVWCKLSGLTTEADHHHWRPEQLKPYLSEILDGFGFDRVLFGGDWPVSTLATDFPRWVETLDWATSGARPEELRKLFHDNAETIYRV